MDNQHKKITGYRELDQSEIDIMNDIKSHGESLADLIEGLRDYTNADPRWLSIGETHLQQGIMALVRAIARPEGF